MNKIKLGCKVKNLALNEQGCVKLDGEARGIVMALMAQTGNDAKYIVSEIVKQAISNDLIVFSGSSDGKVIEWKEEE